VLRVKGFRQLLATRVSAQTADGVLQAGLASYVLFSPERQATGPAIAVAFAVLLLPYSLVGPFTGVLIDRWRRRQILVVANVVRGVLVLGLSALAARGSEGPDFLVLALGALGINRFILAALSAALPHVADSSRLVTANAVSTTAGTVATAVGAAFGLGARFLAGSGNGTAGGIVVASAFGYLLAATLATRLGRDALGPDPRVDGHGPRDRPLDVREELGALTGGVRYLWGRRAAWNALAALGLFRLTFGIMTVLVVLLQRDSFHVPSDATAGLRGVTVTFAALAIGVPLGAIATPPAVRRWGAGRWVRGVMVVTGCGLVLLTLPFRPVPIVGAAFLLGLGGQAVKVSVDSTVQRSVEDQHRGLVFALYDVLFNVAFVAAVAFAAAVLPISGRSLPLALVAGLVIVAGGLWYGSATVRVPADPR
jgi:MFS family permease